MLILCLFLSANQEPTFWQIPLNHLWK